MCGYTLGILIINIYLWYPKLVLSIGLWEYTTIGSFIPCSCFQNQWKMDLRYSKLLQRNGWYSIKAWTIIVGRREFH